MHQENQEDDKTQTHIILTKGTMISHYRIIEKIGAGGMGEVYLAEDTKLKRQVALKFLPSQYASDEAFKARFTREAQAAAKLSHPNIITIYEVSEYRGRPYFAMEHLEGQSLRDLIKGEELRLDKIISLGIQICEGLSKAHQAGITHRDIKPSNIVIDADGRPKLLDFGLATIRGAEQLTKTGSTLGTVGYMSPEQVRGEETDARSDLFSLGVVLYEMITGKPPFKAENEAATLHAIVNDTPPPLARYRSDVPDSLQSLIDKALDKDVETRYQTAAGILADLKREKKALEPHTPQPSVRETLPIATPQKKRISRFLIPGSAVVLIVLLILVLKPWRFELRPDQLAVAAENRLAIMYFDNLAEPEDTQKLGEITANLLITDLSESRYVQVVSSQRLYDILKLLGREGEKKIDRSVASQAAEKANARWMLLGSILQVEPQMILTAQLVEVATGNAVASQRITGEAGEKIFSLVDRLTVEVKNDLSLPAAAQEEPDEPVADVTTHSPEAYRYYLEGDEYLFKFYFAEARKSFEKALALDSTFAMAYFAMSWVVQGSEKNELIARAVKYSDKVKPGEKHWINARAATISGNSPKAIAELKKLLERTPDDKNALHALGNRYREMGQLQEAVRCYNQVIELDPLFKLAYNHLAYTFNDMGDFERSIWAINEYISLVPDEANPYDSRGELYASNGRLEQAIESFKKAVAIKPDFYMSWGTLGHMYVFLGQYAEAEKCYQKLLSSNNKSIRSEGRRNLALIPLQQGRFEEALVLLDQGIAAGRMERAEEWEKHILKASIYAEKGNLEQGLRELDEAISVYETDYPGAIVVSRHLYIQLLAENGEFARAEEIARVWKQDIEEKNPSKIDYYWIAAGGIELSRGEFAASIECFERAADGLPDRLAPVYFRVRFLLARAYLEAGKLGEAVALYETLLSNYSEGRLSWAISSVKAHYYLGQTYEQSGWTDKAIEQYETFLDIWKDAELGIPAVDDARERLARLRDKP